MKLTITIPKDKYRYIQELEQDNTDYATTRMLYHAVKHGTPLPEPFDLEGLKKDMKALNCGFPYGLDYLLDCLDKRLGIKIIEADNGESEG